MFTKIILQVNKQTEIDVILAIFIISVQNGFTKKGLNIYYSSKNKPKLGFKQKFSIY